MFEAINKNFLEKSGSITKSTFFADQTWNAFPDPHKEEWFCCPVCRKPVTPVIPHVRIVNEKEVKVPSFFRLMEGVGGCISTESDEHKKAKILLASLIENEKIILKVGNATIPYSNLNFKEVPRLPFRWEQTRENRRADVLFELSEFHNVLGQGIVFEIQRDSPPEKKKRELDWICNGYSLTWLDTIEFTEDSLTSNEVTIDKVWSLSFAEYVQEMANEIRNLNVTFNQLLKEYSDRSMRTCRTCLHGSKDRTYPDLIACWHGTQWGKTLEARGDKAYPNRHEPQDTCKNFTEGN